MNKKDDFQKFIDVFRSLSLTRNEECLLNEFQRAVDAFPDEKKLTKKAELQESLKNIEWISGPPNMEYVRMIREAQKVVDAMPDDEEKAFVPTEPGWWFRKASEEFDWNPVLVIYNAVNGAHMVETRNGHETIKEYGGIWHPDRILMPGEE